MAQGAFTRGYDKDDDTGRKTGINFQVNPEVDPTPEDQATLMIDIERVIATLNRLFPVGGPSFERYFEDVSSLASAGLVGPNAQPVTAARALQNLKDEILTNEAGVVKNKHLLELGYWALIFAAAAVVLGLCFHGMAQADWLPAVNTRRLGQFCYAFSGAMAGTWISYGYRKAQFTFEDLGKPEADYLWSSIRLIFTGLQTIIIGLLLVLEIVSISFGKISTADFGRSVEIAVVIGLLCGFSEQTLPSAIAKQASALFKKMEPKGS
ncbi:MAG: hypothetical protein AB9900_13155 [Humidesulfovibrio sp.]